jgi:hypothetical protein
MFLNVSVQEHCAPNNNPVEVANFTLITPLLLLSCCRLSFSTVSLKIFCICACTLKSPNTIFI